MLCCCRACYLTSNLPTLAHLRSLGLAEHGKHARRTSFHSAPDPGDDTGRAAGIAVGAGLGLMAAIWTMMALLDFGVVFELFPFLYVDAKAAGAAFLLYIAFRMWRSAGVPARP